MKVLPYVIVITAAFAPGSVCFGWFGSRVLAVLVGSAVCLPRLVFPFGLPVLGRLALLGRFAVLFMCSHAFTHLIP